MEAEDFLRNKKECDEIGKNCYETKKRKRKELEELRHKGNDHCDGLVD